MDPSYPTRSSPASPPFQRSSTAAPHSLFIAGDDAIAALCSSAFAAESCALVKVTSLAAALARLPAVRCALVVTELHLTDGDGVELCRAAKKAGSANLVLVVTNEVTRVPSALAAGCDSVLLKPFPPNLLFARLGRLRRGLQIVMVRAGAVEQAGTNQHWATLPCAKCGHKGVTSFDATSLRRAWYACLQCEHVWIARRHM
jgi:DNA-binding response OmpR family regulator